MRYFGGHLFMPVRYAGFQAHTIQNGLLADVSWKRKAGTLVRLAFGSFNAWNILTPFVAIGCFSRGGWARSLVVYMAPGLLFFSLYFFSDPTYFAFLIAPGLLLAGAGLHRIYPQYAFRVALVALLISVLQMTVVRPLRSDSMAGAVANAYCLKYSGWAIRHRYDPRLSDTLETMHHPER